MLEEQNFVITLGRTLLVLILLAVLLNFRLIEAFFITILYKFLLFLLKFTNYICKLYMCVKKYTLNMFR